MSKLEKARNKGNLSDHGDRFFSLLETIRTANEDNWGDLSPLGAKEEKKLAKRIYSTIPCLEKQPMKVNAVSSYVPRSVMTMYQFTAELVRLNDHLTVLTDEGRKFSPLVRCFTTDKRYAEYRENGDWRPIYDDFLDRNVPAEPAKRLFSHTTLSTHELKELSMEMYEILKGNRAAGLPAPTTQWMSESEYKQCWRASNLMHYLRNSITPVSDAAARATSPLLEDMIAKTDSALHTGSLQINGLPQPTINAWFGHAETLLPLLSLLRLPGCFDMPLDYDRLDECWRIQNITPLGANLLLLVARGPSGRDYACVQLNGRTVQPVKGQPDVLPWEQLRAYWKHQIEAYAK